MPHFTKPQWGEIYKARARLQAYKDKIQPYPSLEGYLPFQEILGPAPTQHHPANAFQQLQGELRHLENALNEHIDKAKKRRDKL